MKKAHAINQAFMDNCLDKVYALASTIKRRGYEISLDLDQSEDWSLVFNVSHKDVTYSVTVTLSSRGYISDIISNPVSTKVNAAMINLLSKEV